MVVLKMLLNLEMKIPFRFHPSQRAGGAGIGQEPKGEGCFRIPKQYPPSAPVQANLDSN